jgi:hypothetical protein
MTTKIAVSACIAETLARRQDHEDLTALLADMATESQPPLPTPAAGRKPPSGLD